MTLTLTKGRTKMQEATYNLLKAVCTATAAAGMQYITLDNDANELQSLGLIEVNTGMGDGNGKFAARATDAGIARSNQPLNETEASAPMGAPGSSNPKPSFERRMLSKLPEKAPRAVSANGLQPRAETYPFSQLVPKTADGQFDGVFVPKSEKMPDPVKSLVSAVSAANRRFAKVTGEKVNAKGKTVKTYQKTRTFEVYPSEDMQNKPGAWIVRTDDGSAEQGNAGAAQS